MTTASPDSVRTIPAWRGAEDWLLLGGRILLASIFVIAGLRKLGDYGMFAGYTAHFGVPAPALLLPLATALEIGGGLLLAIGLWTRWAALALALYTLLLAFIFHAFWAVDPKQLGAQLNLFLFHLETIGGMLYVLAHGAGAHSLDRAMSRRR